jgi:hypothetical protein
VSSIRVSPARSTAVRLEPTAAREVARSVTVAEVPTLCLIRRAAGWC